MLNIVYMLIKFIRRYACAIQLEDMVIMTGGHGSETRVQSYDLSGPLARLPDLRSGRINHGCGHYVHNGKLVSVEIDD